MHKFSCLFNALIMSLVVMMHCGEAQNVITVGDGMGWDIPPNTSVSYSNWVSGRTFRVGDILVFNFATDQHDIVQVPRASYEACSQDNAVGSPILTGPANITLDSAGDHFYICTFGRHCQAGQRLAITVSSSPPGAPAPPTTRPPPTPTTPQPNACAPRPSAGRPTAARNPFSGGPPPPGSGSTSLSNGGLLVLFFVGMALIL